MEEGKVKVPEGEIGKRKGIHGGVGVEGRDLLSAAVTSSRPELQRLLPEFLHLLLIREKAKPGAWEEQSVPPAASPGRDDRVAPARRAHLARSEPDSEARGRPASQRSLGVYTAVYTASPSPPRPPSDSVPL